MADELERALLLRDLELMGQPRNPNAVQPGRAGLLDLGVGLPERLSLLNQIFNPVEAIGQSMNAGERMMSPNMGVMDRLAALGDMASGIAGVVAPVAAASRAGTPAATALMEGLLGGSPDEIARFAADEAGSLPGMGIGLPSPRTDAEAMARDILQLRAEGRAGEVTDQMRAAADPQYMYFNTPLPMDYASRMARANERGFSAAYHGTGSDISAVDPSFFGSGQDLLGSGFYTTTNAGRAERYVPRAKTPSIEVSSEYLEGGNVMPLMVREPRAFELGEPLGDAAESIASSYEADPFFSVQRMSSGAIHIKSADGQSVLLDPMQPKHWALQNMRKAFGSADTSNVLSEVGYSGVAGPESSGHTVRVSYNPIDIRSRFALFDPEFAHLRNLSASLAAAGVPLGLLSMLPEEEQY